jgi:hypothetical protein
VVIFEDSASNFNKWSSSKWNTTTQQYHSPARSIADSPVGEYDDNENNIITLVEPIDLTDRVYASLSFWAKWDIEAGYDYVQVLISDNNGSTWTALQGKYTHPGNSNQANGEPLYDGTQNTWVKEEISLEPYLDKQIKIRFRLISDVYVTGDGYFWDDMTVTVVDIETGLSDNHPLPGENQLSVYPNPASGEVFLKLNNRLPGESGMVKVFDVQGKIVVEKTISVRENELQIDVSGWIPGIYFVNVHSAGTIISSGKFVVRK